MNFHRSFHALTTACLFLSCPGLTRAAPAAEAIVELDPFGVSGDRARSLTPLSLDEVRTALALVPGGTEIIDASRYLTGRASTVDDTFALSAGVVAFSRFGSDEARLSIRGSGLQRTFHGRGLRVLQDGIPVNLADGSFDMQVLEPLSTAYISVWRGANALTQGASTLGGAIEYVSRTGRDGLAGLARLELGSHRYVRGGLAGGGHSGHLDGFISLTHQSQDGFRRHARQNNQRLFSNAAIRFGASGESRFYVSGVLTDSELPGNLTRAQLHADPRQAATRNVVLNQKRDYQLLRVANRTTLQAGGFSWDLTAAWTNKDLDHPIFEVIDQQSDDFLVGVAASRVLSVGTRNQRIRGGIMFHHGVTRSTHFVNEAGLRGALRSQARQKAANVEAFVEDQIPLSRRLTLVIGASAAANRRENLTLAGTTPDYSLRYGRIMPKLGLRWDGNHAQVYANASSSYEPPSFSETVTANSARDAQTATTFELGTRGARGFVRWDFSLYHARVRHELLLMDHDNDPSTPAATFNADDTLHSGAELAASLDLFGGDSQSASPNRRLVLQLAWTYGRFRFHDDLVYSRNTLAGLPGHVVRGELMWRPREGWYAGPTLTWVPQKAWIDHRNTLAADGYAVVGFRLGRRVDNGFSWFLDARNITDQTYAATTGVIADADGLDQPQFLPGDGRSLFGGLEFSW